MSDSTLHGSCLCGTVSFEVDPPFQRMIHCHCSRCRKGTGTGHATNMTAEPGSFRWLSGADAISRFDLPDTRNFSKWFCRECGSPLPRLARNGLMMIIPAGSLDSAPPLSPSDHIFWGSRATWSCASGGLPTHEDVPEAWKAALR